MWQCGGCAAAARAARSRQCRPKITAITPKRNHRAGELHPGREVSMQPQGLTVDFGDAPMPALLPASTGFMGGVLDNASNRPGCAPGWLGRAGCHGGSHQTGQPSKHFAIANQPAEKKRPMIQPSGAVQAWSHYASERENAFFMRLLCSFSTLRSVSAASRCTISATAWLASSRSAACLAASGSCASSAS